MTVQELQDKIKEIGFQDTFYWLQAENLYTSGLQVQSITSENGKFIADLAQEFGIDYSK